MSDGPPTHRRASRALATGLFVASGALGLGYQLVWIRKATLVVGSSQIALSTVVTSFFVGLGVGSLVVGRLRGSSRSPLFAYGLFELAIGAFALAFPWLFAATESLYGSLYGVAAGSPAALFALRFGLLFALFLLPTFFMGGTLPLLLDGLVERDRDVGPFTSFLYGANIVGAVLGVLVTSYFAIPRLGMNGTSAVAGLGNLAIGAVAVLAFRRAEVLHPRAPGPPAAHPPLLFAALAFVSGFAALGYQIAWARYFALFQTGSVHLTALLLAVYLTALATGSLLVSRLLRGGVHPLRWLAWLQPLIPCLALACLGAWRLAAYGHQLARPQGSYEINSTWTFWSETADSVFFAPLFQVTLVLFPAVVLIGTGLPLLVAAATRRSEALRASAGTLVFWNTLGSSAGGFAVGYLGIPTIGLGRTLLVLGGLSIALGVVAQALWAARAAPPSGGPARLAAASGWGIAALAVVVGLAFGRPDLSRTTLERYGWGAQTGDELIAVREGPVTTAYVFGSEERRILGSGNVCHATALRNAVSSQVIQGHLPALFYPRAGTPQRALGIALGSGQAFGALLQHPVKEMDVVDISGEIIDLALAHFGEFNYEIGADPRARIHLDDGRHFVRRAPAETYDTVLMEPAPPTDEGMYALYSIEFYRDVARVLRDDGVFLQWLPLHMVTPNELRGILKTQVSVFPQTFLVRVGKSNFMVLSLKRDTPPRFDLRWLAERVEVMRREPLLVGRRWAPGCAFEVASVEGVLSMLIAGPEDLAAVEARGVYHDDDQRLSYSSGDRVLLRRYEGDALERLTFAAAPITPFRALRRYFVQPIDAAALDEERAQSLEHYNVSSPATLAALRAMVRTARSPAAKAERALDLAWRLDRMGAKDRALIWLGIALRAHPEADGPRAVLRVRRMARNRIAVYADALRMWLSGLPDDLRETPIAQAVARELADHESREADRRSGYLAE